MTETTEQFVLEDNMAPSLQETLDLLKAGGFIKVAHGFGAGELLSQLNAQTGAVWSHRATLVAKGYADTETKLRQAHRLAQASGVLGAERVVKSVATQEATQDQDAPRKALIVTRDAAKALMKNAGIDVDHFPVKFPAGDATHLVGPANTLVTLLKKYQDKLGNPILAAELLEDATAAANALGKAETRQEVGKVEQALPTAEKRAASEALYGILLHFSRVGGVVFRKEPEVAETFQLNTLFRQGGGGGGGAEEGLQPVTEGEGEEGGTTKPGGGGGNTPTG